MDKFVEFYGPGLSSAGAGRPGHHRQHGPGVRRHDGLLPGGRRRPSATCERTGRDAGAGATGWSATARSRGSSAPTQTPDPVFTATLELDLSTSCPSLAGPKRPQDLVPLQELKRNFIVNLPGLMSANVPAARRELAQSTYSRWVGEGGGKSTIGEHGAAVAEHPPPDAPPVVRGYSTARSSRCTTASVVIAAITSCTNTSNPSVMIGAGLLAKKAVERGLTTQAVGQDQPGARLAGGDRLSRRARDCCPTSTQLGFQTVGYGCTTCIGNSGPLPEPIGAADRRARTWSPRRCCPATGTSRRGFTRRCGPTTSPRPMLVVAFALAGRVDIDLEPASRWAPSEDGRAGVPARHLAHRRGDPRARWPARSSRSCSERRYGVGVRGRRDLAGARGARGEPVRLGPGLHLRAGAAVLRRPAGRAAGRSATSPAPACSLCWATR